MLPSEGNISLRHFRREPSLPQLRRGKQRVDQLYIIFLTGNLLPIFIFFPQSSLNALLEIMVFPRAGHIPYVKQEKLQGKFGFPQMGRCSIGKGPGHRGYIQQAPGKFLYLGKDFFCVCYIQHGKILGHRERLWEPFALPRHHTSKRVISRRETPFSYMP